MKLLKKDHYTITRLLLEDSDGKLHELCEDSLGRYYCHEWEGNVDGSIDGTDWQEYSSMDFAGFIFGPGAKQLSGSHAEEDRS